jgi:hypothetical protein
MATQALAPEGGAAPHNNMMPVSDVLVLASPSWGRVSAAILIS